MVFYICWILHGGYLPSFSPLSLALVWCEASSYSVAVTDDVDCPPSVDHYANRFRRYHARRSGLDILLDGGTEMALNIGDKIKSAFIYNVVRQIVQAVFRGMR